MKRNQYLVIAVAAIIAVVALAWPDPKRDTAGVAHIVDVAPDEVAAIVAESDEGRAQLANRGDSDWIAQKGTPSVGSTIMFDAEKRLFPVLGYRALPEEVDPDAEMYGLADPEILLSIKSRAGKTYQVAFGAQTFNTGGFYARLVGSDRVYLLPRRPIDDLRSLIAGKRIDTENIVDQKLRELDSRPESEATKQEDSSWLQQALELENEEAKP